MSLNQWRESLMHTVARLRLDMTKLEIWLKGIFAAAISGGAGGVMTGLAAVGIDPQHFNLQTGTGQTLRIGAAAACINGVIGVSAYLQKSPMPECVEKSERARFEN